MSRAVLWLNVILAGLVAAGAALVTNLITDKFSWTLLALLVVLVSAGISIAGLQATASRRSDSRSDRTVAPEISPKSIKYDPHPTVPTVNQNMASSGGRITQTWKFGVHGGTIAAIVTIMSSIAALSVIWVVNHYSNNGPIGRFSITDGSAPTPSSAFSSDSSPPVIFTVTRMGSSSGSPCRSYWVPTEVSKIGPAPSREGLSDWVFARGGAEIATTDVLVTIRGRSPTPVTLTGLTFQVAKRQEMPTSGTTVSLKCGGGQEAKYVLADLDFEPPKILASSSKVLQIGDQEWRTTPLVFPYVVSSTESETLLVMGATKGLVSWTAELLWSDGAMAGRSTIDDHGKAFMTTCDPHVPQIYLALSGNRWENNPSAPTWPCDTSVAELIAG